MHVIIMRIAKAKSSVIIEFDECDHCTNLARGPGVETTSLQEACLEGQRLSTLQTTSRHHALEDQEVNGKKKEDPVQRRTELLLFSVFLQP